MLLKLLNKLSKKEKDDKKVENAQTRAEKKNTTVTPTRIGEIGEYKIDIQLDQLPKNYKYVSDILIKNRHSKSGYSQIDHVVITPYALLVIETKNYTGTIYGDRNRAVWKVNGKFPMMNPFNQNYGHIQALKSTLTLSNDENIVSMVSFNRRCTFKVNEELRKIQSNDLIVYDTELSEFISRKVNVLKLQNENLVFSDQDILRMYQQLINSNITDADIRNKHIQALNNTATEEITQESEKNKKVKKTETNSVSSHDGQCAKCGTKVTEKVTVYCLANKKRFDGKVYCFEHQKLYK